ncbi:MAG: hypothetical protein GXY48_06425 [Methanomicrobiales archaeon]|nr:hypothetical protein [Methanomicrobiales archaeon]
MPTVKKPSKSSAIKNKAQNYDFFEANVTSLHTKGQSLNQRIRRKLGI